jgi:hypothetical protein
MIRVHAPPTFVPYVPPRASCPCTISPGRKCPCVNFNNPYKKSIVTCAAMRLLFYFEMKCATWGGIVQGTYREVTNGGGTNNYCTGFTWLSNIVRESEWTHSQKEEGVYTVVKAEGIRIFPSYSMNIVWQILRKNVLRSISWRPSKSTLNSSEFPHSVIYDERFQDLLGRLSATTVLSFLLESI